MPRQHGRPPVSTLGSLQLQDIMLDEIDTRLLVVSLVDDEGILIPAIVHFELGMGFHFDKRNLFSFDLSSLFLRFRILLKPFEAKEIQFRIYLIQFQLLQLLLLFLFYVFVISRLLELQERLMTYAVVVMHLMCDSLHVAHSLLLFAPIAFVVQTLALKILGQYFYLIGLVFVNVGFAVVLFRLAVMHVRLAPIADCVSLY